MSIRYLVIHDVDAIQQYIFATNRLQEIRGASAIIDQINVAETRRQMKQPRDQLIYTGGGGAAADFADETEADAFWWAISALYAQKTISASSTGVVVDYDDADPEGFQHALARAHHDLQQKKARRRRETQVLTSPYFKRCQSCGIYPAGRFHDSFPEPAGQFVCESCWIKRCQKRHPRIHQFIARSYHSRTDLFPRELDEIGQCAKPKGYIGVVYADGNRIGDRLQKIKTKSGLKEFSELLRGASRHAIEAALKNRPNLLITDHGRRLLPILVPLYGGDDIVIVVPGQHALQIAVKYLEEFQVYVRQHMSPMLEEELGSRKISACAGVVIAKAHTPLSSLFELAEDLCRVAKKRSHDLSRQQEEVEEPCIDFQVVTTPNWGEVRSTREQQFMVGQDFRLTCRPYTVAEVNDLIEFIRGLKREKFPPGKLHSLYQNLWRGRYQATLHYLMLYVRARESPTGPKQKTALREAKERLGVNLPPWKDWPVGDGKFQTPYADLVEIYQFIEDEEERP